MSSDWTRKNGSHTTPNGRSGRVGRSVALLVSAVAAVQAGASSLSEDFAGAERRYRACVDAALEIDLGARLSASPEQYGESARSLEQCEADFSGNDAGTSLHTLRMRVYALSIQNRFKAGEVAQARENFERFRAEFRSRDLILPSGASFVDTMKVLLGFEDPARRGVWVVLRTSKTLEQEFRRAHHWSSH